MRIGIIGSGNIGGTAAKLFARAGHQIAISNSRDPSSLEELTKSIGANATAVTPEDAARFGDIILLAIPWIKKHELLSAESFKKKIVIDAMNPYSANSEVINLGTNTTSTEEVAKRIPEARIVKAFNTIYYRDLDAKGNTKLPKSDRLVIFLAGDDIQAKTIVSNLIEEIGFTPVDTGSLRSGGYKQQPGSPIYNVPMTSDQAKKLLAEATDQ